MVAETKRASQDQPKSVVPPSIPDDVAAAFPNPEEEKRPPRVALICLMLINFVEGVDIQIIFGCLFALQRDLGVTLGNVAVLTSTQMITANISAVFWGILADRGMLQRRSILILGCLGEALAMTGLALVPSFLPMVFLRAMAGFFLAALRPVCTALVADMTSDTSRGTVFGEIAVAYMLGMFCTTMLAGNVANLWVFHIAGWRLVMGIASVVAYLVAGAVWKFMIEPPHDVDADAGSRSIVNELWTLLRYLRIPTFSVMILNGIFNNMPWTVMGNNLLFFQLSGLPDWQASFLTSTFTITTMFGGLLGGWVADASAKRLGLHGRPLSGQVTVAIGIPLMYLQFWGIPPGEGSFLGYFLIFGTFGLMATWAPTATNMPILSHIIPAGERCKVMAWEAAFESSLANAIGPASVAMLADSIFGYKFGDANETGKSIVAATALGKAMAVTICLPWMVSFFFYSLLHWSYPRDIQNLEKKSQRKCQNYGSAV